MAHPTPRLAGALLCAALLLPLPALAESHGKVSLAEGLATRSAGDKSEPCAEGMELSVGDKLATGPDGRLELLLEDGTVVRVGPSSELEVSELAFEPEQATLKARLKLMLGTVWAHVEKLAPEGRFEVATERAVAGVRGTEFRVDSGAEAGSVEVYHGKVAVSSERLGYLGESEGAPPEGAAPGAPGAAGRGEVLVEPGRHLRLGADGMRLYLKQRREDAFQKWVRGRPRPAREAYQRLQLRREERLKDKKEKREKLRERRRERRSERLQRRRQQ